MFGSGLPCKCTLDTQLNNNAKKCFIPSHTMLPTVGSIIVGASL